MDKLNQSLWRSEASYQSLVNLLHSSSLINATGLVSLSVPSLLESLFTENKNRSILFISSQEQTASLNKLANQIKRLHEQSSGNQTLVNVFPTAQVSPFDGLAESEQHFAKIVRVLSLWQSQEPSITVCSAKSLLQPVISPQQFHQHELTLTVKSEVNLTKLLHQLVVLGYQRVDTVVEVGTFAQRGEILDIFPANQAEDLPLRINFFGDEIETIKPFEPWTQRSQSGKQLNSITISLLRPFILPIAEAKENLLNRLKSFASEIEEAQSYFWLEDLRKFSLNDAGTGEWQRFIPWLQENFVSPLSYFPADGLIIIDEPHSLTAHMQQSHERLLTDLNHKLDRRALPHSQREHLEKFVNIAQSIPQILQSKKVLQLQLSSEEDSTLFDKALPKPKTIDLQTNLVPQFRANFEELKKFLEDSLSSNSQGPKKIWLSSDAESELRAELADFGEKISFIKPLSVDRGFSIGNTILLTDFELFNKKAVAGPGKKALFKPEDVVPIDLQTIRPGDFLVHIKHGIGKFWKLKTIELEGKKREYITLEYLNGDLLNVPVDQMNLLTLYKGAAEGQAPKLSRLGGIDWEKTKKTVRSAVEKIAQDLVELYAKRSLEIGFNFGQDTPWQTELEDSFPYKETADQIKAINEIKYDMESGRIMDRLLCGDVGFGKTEVVIRAAFKAVMAGKQVAILAPTTILAQQHFKSFKERIGKFPVRLELLTGSQDGAVKKEAIKKLKTGETDLVIGTHALLSKLVDFNDIGLIVVDEEQKFGVNHKEKLKKIKSNVAVLTVSATPIPRTMHMALSGIREMSLISTAPPGRVPIKTQIMPEDPKLIRAAVLRELERGGQVFYLHNRVETIQSKAVDLMKLVPEASFRVAHGRMSETEITEVMSGFIDHDFDVLVATSIIENGIDIPNANTMIIERADKLGLGQLYQLRGRVGRSNDPSRPGFALLMHPPSEVLNEQAKARLETIARYGSLGSGYQIALRDMEIRGVGNMLGQAQHGKVVSVGFELYCEMLNEEIMKLKESLLGSPQADKPKPSKLMSLEEKPVLDFKVNAYIPVDWIEDDVQRVKEYQRLSEANSLLQITSLADEWADRFGSVPQPVAELLRIVRLRIAASESLITGIIRPRGDFLELNTKINFNQWKELQNEIPQWLKDRLAIRFPKDASAQIIIRISELNTSDQLDLLEQLFKELSSIAQKK
jgi:transcription-repair coupling factor (superfamily II helicase)